MRREDVRGHNPQASQLFYAYIFSGTVLARKAAERCQNPIGPSQEGLSRRIWMGRLTPLTLVFRLQTIPRTTRPAKLQESSLPCSTLIAGKQQQLGIFPAKVCSLILLVSKRLLSAI